MRSCIELSLIINTTIDAIDISNSLLPTDVDNTIVDTVVIV